MRAAIKSIFEYRPSEYQQLNGLRALAIIGVMTCHFYLGIVHLKLFPDFNIVAHTIIRYSFWYVDMFFVISGFLVSGGLYYSWEKKKGDYFKSFYLKRWIRILPPYYIFLTIGLIFLILKIAALQAAAPSETVLQNLTHALQFKDKYIFDYLFLTNFFEGAQPHTWALAVEEQFYLVFPLVGYYFLFKLKPGKRVIILISLWTLFLLGRIGLTLYGIYGFEVTPEWDVIRRTGFDSLILGVLVMELFNNYKDVINRLRGFPSVLLFFGGLAIIIIFVLHKVFTPGLFLDYIRRSMASLGCAMMLLSVMIEGSPVARFFSSRVLTPISRVSYTMYLWHFLTSLLVLQGMFNLKSSEMNYLLYVGLMVFYIFSTFIISIILYLCFEYPFMKLKERFR